MNALESANMNLQTMEAMKRGSEALKGIHGKMYVSTRPRPDRSTFSTHKGR